MCANFYSDGGVRVVQEKTAASKYGKKSENTPEIFLFVYTYIDNSYSELEEYNYLQNWISASQQHYILENLIRQY